MKYWKAHTITGVRTLYFMREDKPLGDFRSLREMTLKEWNEIYAKYRPQIKPPPKVNVISFSINWDDTVCAYEHD